MFQPEYSISPQLLETIKQITLRVHDLNRRVLPEVVYARLLHEARVTSTYASTSIEGNPLPLTEVRRILKNEPDQVRDSEREVLNYNRALNEFAGSGKKLTEVRLLALHAVVMDGLLPAHQSGAYRKEPVVIRDPRSAEIVFLPPDHGDVPGLIEALFGFAEASGRELDPVLLAGIFHRQFVLIHPFMDGNGRTARLATQVLLAGMGLDLFPLLSLETYYNRNVTRYFRAVGAFGNYYDLAPGPDFTLWLEYFAGGILDELDRLAKQLAAARTPETALRPHDEALLAYIDEHGFIRDKDYAGLVDRAKATRALDFRRLMELGYIERKGKGRGTYYVRAGDPQ